MRSIERNTSIRSCGGGLEHLAAVRAVNVEVATRIEGPLTAARCSRPWGFKTLDHFLDSFKLLQ